MLDEDMILNNLAKAEAKREEINNIEETKPVGVRRRDYIKSHLELLGLTFNDYVLEHLYRELPTYLRDIEVAVCYAKYQHSLAERHRHEVEELGKLLDKYELL